MSMSACFGSNPACGRERTAIEIGKAAQTSYVLAESQILTWHTRPCRMREWTL